VLVGRESVRINIPQLSTPICRLKSLSSIGFFPQFPKVRNRKLSLTNREIFGDNRELDGAIRVSVQIITKDGVTPWDPFRGHNFLTDLGEPN
jgi:hypothetical protein